MNEEQVRQIIRDELSALLGSDRYTFQKHIQMFDGRNIQIARGTGTQIATAADQKIAFHGASPVVQAGFISSPSADLTSLKNAVDSIRNVLINKGLTASS